MWGTRGDPRELRFTFFRSPLEILDDGTGRVASVRLAVNRLEPGGEAGTGPQRAVPIGETEEVPVGARFPSTGP